VTQASKQVACIERDNCTQLNNIKVRCTKKYMSGNVHRNVVGPLYIEDNDVVVRPLQIDTCLRTSFYTVKIHCVVMCDYVHDF